MLMAPRRRFGYRTVSYHRWLQYLNTPGRADLPEA